jgi:NAD(P)-dependent dehydrogenase (short-subunit alcohol dehydrogenase family)
MELQGKVAVVTGGGSGIGKATALLFAHEGARVAVVGRTREELEATVAEIDQAGGEGMIVEADISAPGDMIRLYADVRRRWGRLDIVFAHAGINGVWAPVEELEPEEWTRTIENNLSGTFFTIKYAVPMLKENGGSIVITSSINGTRVFTTPGATAYSTSKAGQIALMQMLALELGPHRIRVNAICPGAIETDVEQHTERRQTEEAEVPVEFPEGTIPLTGGTPGRAEQVADLVLFLASERSSHITGTPVWIDGGQSLLQG